MEGTSVLQFCLELCCPDLMTAVGDLAIMDRAGMEHAVIINPASKQTSGVQDLRRAENTQRCHARHIYALYVIQNLQIYLLGPPHILAPQVRLV